MKDDELYSKIKNAVECIDINMQPSERTTVTCTTAQSSCISDKKKFKLKYMAPILVASIAAVIVISVTVNDVLLEKTGDAYNVSEISLDDVKSLDIIYPNSTDDVVCYKYTTAKGVLAWVELHTVDAELGWSEYVVLDSNYVFNTQTEFCDLNDSIYINDIVVSYKTAEADTFSSFAYGSFCYYFNIEGNLTELESLLSSMI